eukprot:1070044-Rhodomonas_salina.3
MLLPCDPLLWQSHRVHQYRASYGTTRPGAVYEYWTSFVSTESMAYIIALALSVPNVVQISHISTRNRTASAVSVPNMAHKPSSNAKKRVHGTK